MEPVADFLWIIRTWKCWSFLFLVRSPTDRHVRRCQISRLGQMFESKGNLHQQTYKLLLSSHDLGPAILLVGFRRGVCSSVLLQTAFHAVDGAPADFQTAVDGGGVYAGFQELDDLLLDMSALLAAAGHFICVFDGWPRDPTGFVVLTCKLGWWSQVFRDASCAAVGWLGRRRSFIGALRYLWATVVSRLGYHQKHMDLR